MKTILTNKVMLFVVFLLLGIMFVDAYVEKNDLFTANETSQNEIIAK